MKLGWNFQRGGGGGGGLRENPFHGGGMDNFWNHTLVNKEFTQYMSYCTILIIH